MENYVTVDVETYFNTIPEQLSKIAVAFSYALNTNKKIVLIEDKNSNEISDFFQIYIKKISKEEYDEMEFITYDLNSNSADTKIPNLEGNICLKGIITNNLYIHNDIKMMLNILIMHNTNYINNVNYKINEILTYFNDSNDSIDINNFVGIIINSNDSNNLNIYKDAFNNFFDKTKKIVIFTDNIEWCKEKIELNTKIYYYDFLNSNKYETFILMAKLNNLIINDSIQEWWVAYLGNNDKEVINLSSTINTTPNYKSIDSWTKYS